MSNCSQIRLFRTTTLPDCLWQDMAVDLLVPLQANQSILVVVDDSHYYEYDGLISTTTKKIIDSLEDNTRMGLNK